MVEQRSQRVTLLEEFKARLKSEWTRKVACERECESDAQCVCQRHFIHTEKLESWMNRQDSQAPPNTKATGLLDELHDKIKHHRAFGLPLDPASIFTGDNRSLIMFSMLLDQDRGDLIDIFHNAGVCDKYLGAPDHIFNATHSSLRHHLREKRYTDTEINEIIEIVGRERQAYCSRQLTLHMDASFEREKAVMPFCRRMRVNNKGGTASVFWVAVQKDLITDQKLRDALDNCLYPDPEFGPCYQMALKSYREEKKDIFDWEKEAFSMGLKYDPDAHIVRYLGSYSHDNGDKKDGKTYNLLLEFGEKDLEEYCADLTNVPPVRAWEIIRFWESLFQVADAVEKIHNLRIKQGRRTKDYNGWHADIKPDNILMVHGKFKLADFGFSRFAEKVGPAVPAKSYIEGGTDTYGAPEFARMKASGTRSEVTQTIDTWSFGCVLSVAATWVVLGYQGVLQYRKLREQSSSTKTPLGKPTDRFHDGHDVLPEIKLWHNFLRGHTRNADTATPLVLKLIEVDMLQKDTQNRLSFKDLCNELRKLIKSAEATVEDLPDHSKDTDDSVKRALYAMEKEAENRTSDANATPLKRASRLAERTVLLSVANANPSVRVSSRNNKEDILRDFPRAQIPYRKEILEKELHVKPVLEQSIHESPGGLHDGAHTSSPVDDSPSPGKDIWFPPSKARGLGIETQPESSTNHQNSNTTVPTILEPTPSREISSRRPRPVDLTASVMHSHHLSQSPQVTTGADVSAKSGIFQAKPPDASIQHKDPDARNRIFASKAKAGHPTTSQLPATSFRPKPTAFRPATPYFAMDSHEVPAQRSQPDRIGKHNGALEQESLPEAEHPSEYQSSPQLISNHKSHTQDPRAAPIVAVGEEAQQPVEAPTLPSSPDRQRKEKQAVFDSPAQQPLPPSPVAKQFTTLPASVFQLPWDVCRVRFDFVAPTESKSTLSKLQSKAKGMLGMETQRRDETLANVIYNRELIFVIDNASTMLKHWPILTFVAETLCMKVAGLDKNGIDLRFTVGGRTRNRTKLRGENGRAQFRRSIHEAKPKIPVDEEHHARTDMKAVLHEIFKEWRENERKATTLIILTDGVWESTIPSDAADKEIVAFAKEVQEIKAFAPRHFSIGFVRFGEDKKARLQRLDDELCNTHKDRYGRDLEDIIDHCSWRSTVYKMLVGSLDPYQDQNDPNENVIDYDYQALNNLFDMFNRGVPQPPVVLQVPQSPPADSSRPSSRGSWQQPHGIQRYDTEPPIASPTKKPKKRFSHF